MSTTYNNNNTQTLTFQTRNEMTRGVERESQNQFTNLTNKGEHSNRNCPFNNHDIIDRINRIVEPQKGNNFFEETFFNGTNFNDNNNSFESLILSPFSQFP